MPMTNWGRQWGAGYFRPGPRRRAREELIGVPQTDHMLCNVAPQVASKFADA